MNQKLITLIAICAFLIGAVSVKAESTSVVKPVANKKMMKIDIQSKRIPAGTKISVRMETPLNTIGSNAGDQFNSTIIQDIKSGNDIILPAGTMIRGTVGDVKRAALLSTGAEMVLYFDHVVTPIGKQIPVYAVLTNIDNLTLGGGISSGSSYSGEVSKGFKKGKDIATGATSWGIESGSSFWGGYPVLITVPVAAAAGTVGGTSYFLGKTVISIFQKGGDVVIPTGKVLEIRLTQPLDIPVN
jgi:hypothetical protein